MYLTHATLEPLVALKLGNRCGSMFTLFDSPRF